MKRLLAALFCLIAADANAMTYSTDIDPDTGRVRLYASGGIEDTEYDAFAQAVVRALAQMQPDNPFRPLVILESEGGNPVSAMDMGRLIRAAELDTFVPAGGIGCRSACTLAFLGGVKRRIEGDFGIHAARRDNALPVTPDVALGQGFVLQWIAADQIAYAREMIGNDSMILEALRIGQTTTVLVNDIDLANWSVISVASRPSQYLPIGDGILSYCPSPLRPEGVDPVAFSWLCSELDLARLYRQVELLEKDLAGDDRAATDLGQADRFDKAWQGCSGVRFSDALPEAMELARTVSADRRIPNCIGTALLARRDQLAAIRDYLAVIDSSTAQSWVDVD